MSGETLSDPNLDPAVEAMARRVLAAAADLETASAELERTDFAELWKGATVVTEELMRALAAMPVTSMELKVYGARVDRGECSWSEIEQMVCPLPPEVQELKGSPAYVWRWSVPAASPATDTAVLSGGSGVVGPSDWPDDFDEYPTQQSWLV